MHKDKEAAGWKYYRPDDKSERWSQVDVHCHSGEYGPCVYNKMGNEFMILGDVGRGFAWIPADKVLYIRESQASLSEVL